MRLTRLACLAAAGALISAGALAAPDLALAAGNDVAQNLSTLARHYAAEVYSGVIAVVSLVFLVHRRYGEMWMFLLATVVVGWMVFSPDSVAQAGRSIGKAIFG